jgi:TonB-dependent starch-binding outer membrane protein SusC
MQLTACHKLLCTTLIFFALSGTELLLAQTGDRVTLSVENASLQTIFSTIETQTSYRFVFTGEQLKDGKPVTLSVNAVSVETVLKQCFQGQPLYYSLEDKFIIVHRKEREGKADPAAVTGIVKNDKGDPVVGASVTVLETQKATITSADGSFKLQEVPSSATLIFSGTNVEGRQIILHGQQLVSVVLKAKISKLDEVQIIAYGSTTKRLNTGNVSTVTAETIAEQPVSNPLAALEGRVPGLVITQNSGTPGSGFFVQIQGQNSIANGNDPFYVIDGVPYSSTSLASIYTSSIIAGGNPLSSINPADIESINILKDADATSIYGSRGANGVILITTKHGKAGKTKVDLNTYYGAGKIDRSINLLNTRQYLTMRNEAFKNDGATPSLSNGDYDLLVWDTTRYTDWQKLLIGNTANITDAQLTISGGNVNTQFSLGGGYHRETTVFPGNYADAKGSGHFSLNHISNDNKLKIDLSMTYGVENNNLPAFDFVSQAMSLPPDAPAPYDSSGKLNWPPGFSNPYSVLLTKYAAKTNNLISHAVFNYSIITNLQIRVAMGYNNIQMTEIQTSPRTSFNPAYNPVSGHTFFTNSGIETWILEPQVEYQKLMGPGKMDFLMGMTFEQDVKNAQTQYADGFSSDELLKNIAAASNVLIYNNNYSQYKYQAFFGRLNYNMGEKYILNLTARRDGSSRFGPGKQFANFGAVGAAWIFTNEPFAKKLFSFLSFGKIRTSYGITGNDQIGDYQYLSTYSATPFPYQNASGLMPTNLFNPDFAWETNKKYEVGMELGMMNDRLLFSATYYNNHSSNQLVGYPLPYFTGFPLVQQNLPAVVQNTGFEFTANYSVLKSASFNWTVSANLTIPNNKLVSFPNISQTNYNNQYEVGKPLSIYKSFQYLDVNPQTGIYEFSSAEGKPTLSPVYPDDIKAIKEVGAKYYGGLQNNFQYKGWRLDIFLQFTKQTGWNYIKYYYTVPGMQGNQPEVVMNRWSKPGDIATFQQFSQSYESAFYGYLINSAFHGDNAVSDASFIRLKNISLSYTLPGSTVAKLKIQNLRIYLQGQNLLTITHYFGMDPENQSSFSLPPLRVFSGGLQVTF